MACPGTAPGSPRRCKDGDPPTHRRTTGVPPVAGRSCSPFPVPRSRRCRCYSSARSSGEMSSTSWPWSSTSTRRFMRLTRPRSWLATSTLVPRSGSSANSAMISADRVGSRLPVGSSATSSRGSPTRARAMPTRCCSPADSCVGSARSRAPRPSRSRIERTRLPTSARFMPRRINGRETFSWTLRSASRRWSWNTTPTSRRCSGTRRPRTRSRLRSPNSTAPRLGRSARWMSLSRVLLPAPEWPVTNSISPAWTSKLTSLRAACPPGYCLLTLSKRRTAMPGFYRGAALRLVPGRRPATDQRLESATDPRQQRRPGRGRRLGFAPRLGCRRRMAAAATRIALRGLGSLRGVALAAFDALAAATPAALARRALAFDGGSRRRWRGSGRGRGRRRILLAGAAATGFARTAAAGIAASAAPTAAAPAATAATLLVGGTLFTRLAEDVAHAFAFFLGRDGARLARLRDQQVGGHRLDRDLLLDVGLDVRQRDRIALAGEADRIALLAQARGAADTVDVVLGVERQVVVVDVLDAVDVQAAGGHVGGDQDLELALLEPRQQGLALFLRHVAGKHAHAVAGALQRPGDALDEDLGVDEHHGPRALAAGQQAEQQRKLLVVGRQVHALADLGVGDVFAFDHHLFRLVHVLVGELEHAVAEGGREQQRLALR